MTVRINVNEMAIINPGGTVANMTTGMKQAGRSHVD